MNTVDLLPSRDAASATPCAWLPALAATTPRARSAGDRLAMRTYAPRILNDPVRCRFSHLNLHRPADPLRQAPRALQRGAARHAFEQVTGPLDVFQGHSRR